jgi:hypothetical protein
MASKHKNDLEHRIDNFYALCEKILLRTLIFACFVYELARFVKWFWIVTP